MTAYAELISINISEVCAIVVRVIVGPQARRPFAGRSVCKRADVCLINRLPVTRKQGHHLAIPTSRGIAIIWLSNKEQWPRCVRCNPPCPRLVALAELEVESQLVHQSRIKFECTVEVANTYKNVRNHFESRSEVTINILTPVATDNALRASDRPDFGGAEHLSRIVLGPFALTQQIGDEPRICVVGCGLLGQINCNTFKVCTDLAQGDVDGQ